MSVKWKDIVSGVTALLMEDGERVGYEEVILRAIRTGAINLQHYIPQFRKFHSTLIPNTELIEDGEASLATMPENIDELKKVVVVTSPDDEDGGQCQRIDYDPWPWMNRQSLICGTAVIYDNDRGYYAISQDKAQMYLWPALTSLQNLVVEHDGIKLDFSDEEPTPFEPSDEVIEALALWVKSKLSIFGENDPAAMLVAKAEYRDMRRELYTRKRR